MNRLYEMDTRGAVSTITINVFFFIIFGYIKLNALLLSDDFFTRNQHLQCIFGIFAIDSITVFGMFSYSVFLERIPQSICVHN